MLKNVCIIALLAFSVQHPAFAGSEAEVFHVKGNVKVGRGGMSKVVKVGTKLKKGDRLSTGRDALVLFGRKGEYLMKLEPKSQVKLAEPAMMAGQTASVTLIRGGAFTEVTPAAVGKKIKGVKDKPRFQLRTKSATMGVRGTRFFAAFSDRKDRDLWMCVNDGKVEVAAGGKKNLVKKGEGVMIKKGKDLTPPKKYGWTKNLNWNMDPKAGTMENKAKLDDAYSDPLDEDYD